MQKTLIYLTHARIPSDKTPYPFILKTCEGFAKEGWRVELWPAQRYNPWFSGVTPKVAGGLDISIVWIPVIDWMRSLGRLGFVLMILSYNIALAVRLFKYRGSKNIQVYAHDLRDIMLAVFIGVPLSCEVHDFFESSLGIINRSTLPRIQHLIVTNSIKAKLLYEKYGISHSRMLIQPNAVSAEDFDIPLTRKEARGQLSLPQNARIAMYTGHLYAWKGVYTLAEAVRFLPDDTQIYFVGGTDFDRKALQKFVAEKNLPHITFIEQQPHEKMPLYQRAADVVVLPNTATAAASREETSPVKLFEYLASGTPVVASDLPSVREIVTEKEVIFARPDDPQDLARAIQEAVNSPDETRSVHAVALARKHSWPARAKAISSFLQG